MVRETWVPHDGLYKIKLDILHAHAYNGLLSAKMPYYNVHVQHIHVHVHCMAQYIYAQIALENSLEFFNLLDVFLYGRCHTYLLTMGTEN